ncbi:MAG: EAL domain-containing protein [Aquincola sp.]|nr:EAL domain-containing protein [Aquincola sp.]MDH4287324.1 EAL domain-containing protein [Aquincola sp.]MDH5331297.1 EAL domain-containing protein [Aquincola sp.]
MEAQNNPPAKPGILQRLHAVLMPDYNRTATVYWWLMVALGGACLVYAGWEVHALPLSVLPQLLAGTALAVLAGFFPVRIPGSKNSFVAGEVFIFLLLLMHGTSAATLAAAGEAFIGSYRSSKRWTSRIASPTFSALAMSLAGHLMEATLGVVGSGGTAEAGVVLLVASAVAVAYWLLNTVFISLVITFKRNERFRVQDHLSSFGSVGIAYGGSALIAALLSLTVQQSGMGVLLGALPVVAMLLTTIHYFMRQQEAQETVRRSRMEAAEREAQQAARHVAALSDSERRFHNAFTHASIGMALVSFEGRILQANTALAGILGYERPDGLAQQPFSTLVAEDDRASLQASFEQIASRAVDKASLEVRCLDSSHAPLWASLNCAVFNEPDSETPCLIVQVQDISARRHAEAQLNHIAFHDGLTGLPNRGRFYTILSHALHTTKEDPEQHFALMFLDFDRFKLINDSMGHSAGDEFLIQVSRRIQDHMRPSDVVARLGGDEFAVLMHRMDDAKAATHLAERLQQVLRQPLLISGVAVTTSASMGVTFSSLGYTAPEEMLRDADTAMYRAKANGKARCALFDAALHTEVSNRLQLENDLREVIAKGELEIVYQPLFHIRDGHVRGFEALSRWTHPVRGPIPPSTFIPIAEEAGLIVELSDLMLVRACAQLRQWQELDPSLHHLKLQVNMSATDLAHSELFERVARALRATHFSPHLLTLELTESILMTGVEAALPAIEALRRLGVALAIDDFGTGYSSLSYLSTLPIDSLKIDRSFVHGMRMGSKDAEIVRAIVSLGATLGKSVVAEGIETVSQLGQLRDLGCEQGQGFHLSHPLKASEAQALLEAIVAERRHQHHPSFDTGMMPLTHH